MTADGTDEREGACVGEKNGRYPVENLRGGELRGEEDRRLPSPAFPRSPLPRGKRDRTVPADDPVARSIGARGRPEDGVGRGPVHVSSIDRSVDYRFPLTAIVL